MDIEVRIPELAESITEGTLLNWTKGPGAEVSEGEHLVDLETDKVMLEIAAPGTGVLKEILKGEDEVVEQDEVIAIIDTEATAQPAATPTREAAAGRPVATDTPKLGPSVRKLLDEHGLKPGDIPGSRPDRLSRADVQAYLDAREQAAAAPASPSATEAPKAVASSPPAGERPDRRVPMTRLRRRIAERLLAAQHEHAILTTFNEVNMQPVMALRARYRDEFEGAHGVRLGFMSLFVAAAVQALKRFPEVNASLDGDDIVYHGYFDLGIAVSSPRGLVVPVLRNADEMALHEVESGIRELADKARNNTLNIEDLEGGTFTITNGGIFGSLLSTPILNPPQSAILGMHKIQERPVVENGEIVARPMMYLALSYDHRIIDGREAVQFLVAIKEHLEDPCRLLLDL